MSTFSHSTNRHMNEAEGIDEQPCRRPQRCSFSTSRTRNGVSRHHRAGAQTVRQGALVPRHAIAPASAMPRTNQFCTFAINSSKANASASALAFEKPPRWPPHTPS